MHSHSSPTNNIVGSILWLPPKTSIPPSHHNQDLTTTNTLEEGCYNHPVLILSVNQTKTEVVILIITSFSNRDLSKRHPHDARARALHIPIHPSAAHPDNSSLLYLTGAARLARNSYVKIERWRIVKLSLLRKMRRPMCTIRPDSMHFLCRVMGFTAPWEGAGEGCLHKDGDATPSLPIVRQVPMLTNPVRNGSAASRGAWVSNYRHHTPPTRAGVQSGYVDERTSLLRPRQRNSRARGAEEAHRNWVWVIWWVLLVAFATLGISLGVNLYYICRRVWGWMWVGVGWSRGSQGDG